MPPKNKQSRAEAEPSGVDVRPPKVVRYEDGVPVRTTNDGHSAETDKEKD